MDTIALVSGGAAVALSVVHIGTAAIAAFRQRPRRRAHSRIAVPQISIIRPLKGVEPFSHATLKSTFELQPAAAQILFCVESASDPVVPLVQRLIAAHPGVPAQLLIGRDPISGNPKLNNLVKGWAAANHDWIALIDSNVLLPADALERLVEQMKPGVGIVCSPPVGRASHDFTAKLECAFLNAYQARWQSSADALGQGFAQGKVMYLNRRVIDAGGGLAALGAESAEDAAATKLVRRQGLQVRLVNRFFEQPVPQRKFSEVWARQLRWAQLRRASFPLMFAMEIFSGIALPLVLTGVASAAADQPVVPILLMFICFWFGVESLLGRLLGWPGAAIQNVIRDLLLPIIWVQAWVSKDFVWHGHAMRAERDTGRPALSSS